MTERTIPVRNPRSGLEDYRLRCTDAEQVMAVAASVRSAQPAWLALGLEGRAEALERWAVEVTRHRDALLDALVEDTGRYRLSVSEVEGLPSKIRRWCRMAPGILRTEAITASMAPSVRLDAQYVPYPVAGVISPWNFPLSLAFIDTLPALIAGCAVLLKPSEITPRFIEPLLETVRAVPEVAAVLAILPGDGETGQAVVNAADIVCFTGSVATGRRVAVAAASRFIPAFLELGGKDPAIVLASADLDRATDAILRQGMVNAGQVCLSIERVYVDAKIADAFLNLLTKKASALEINHPDIHRGHIGPIISLRQAAIIEEHLREARELGAVVRCGGDLIEKGGIWCTPTIISNVDHRMRIMREETFGPIIPVAQFTTVDQAIVLANDSDYGLSAAVFAASEEEAISVARRLEAGGVSINDGGLQARTTEAEKHSFKFSGLGGSRMGAAGLLRFVRRKALMIQTGTPRTMDAFDEQGSLPG